MQQHRGRGFIVNPQDNVATAMEEINFREVSLLGSAECLDKIEVREKIPFGHKFAVKDISEGSSVIKYGVSIGTATRDILRGQHVHLHNMKSNFDLRASTYDTVTAESKDIEYRVY